MAKNKRSSGNALARLFNQNGVKMILGLVAAGSFAFAFGQEKIQQLVAGAAPSNAACLDQFYRDAPPYLMKDSLNKHSYPLCFNGFNVMYSGVSKTPLWVAEALTPSRLSQKIPREDSFHEETRVNAEHRALLSDYRASGYDRGHMAPNADMPNKDAQFDSFSLANMVPQAPKTRLATTAGSRERQSDESEICGDFMAAYFKDFVRQAYGNDHTSHSDTSAIAE